MEWSDEDVKLGRKAWASSGTSAYCPTWAELTATMTCAVELAAAHGGTMTAGGVKIWCDAYGDKFPMMAQHVIAIGARNATLEQQRRLDMEHEEITKREVSALPGETVMGAARRLFQEQKTLEGLNKAAGEEIAQFKQEVERLEEDLLAMAQSHEDTVNERDAALKRAESLAAHLSTMRVRAETAEARVRQLTIAGQELSAAVDKHVGEPNPSTASNGSATTPGHHERAEAFNSPSRAYNDGVEAMRAACWEEVQDALMRHGFVSGGASGVWSSVKAAIEGATP